MNRYGNEVPPPTLPNAGYSNHNSNPNPYSYPTAAGGGGGVGIPETLASIPDDQKAMIMRVISMTPEQIGLLPPQERASIIQLVRTIIFVVYQNRRLIALFNDPFSFTIFITVLYFQTTYFFRERRLDFRDNRFYIATCVHGFSNPSRSAAFSRTPLLDI